MIKEQILETGTVLLVFNHYFISTPAALGFTFSAPLLPICCTGGVRGALLRRLRASAAS